MKTTSFLLLALTGVLAAGPGDNYVNFIRQIQADTGVDWQVDVASSGEVLPSPEGVGPKGSYFELWSVHSPTAKSYLLDEQYASSYLPTAKLTITTADPYLSVPRTRVDQPFSVTVTVAGLDDGTSGLAPEDIPEAALNVAFRHTVASYPEGANTLPDGSTDRTTVREGYITENGDTTVRYELTNLTAADLTGARGEEVFTVSSLADFGVTASVLDSKRVQIWPIASGSISGLDPTKRYTDIPPILVDLNNLYPASETYIRAYRGAPSSAPVEPFLVLGSYVLVEDSIPQARDLVIKNVNHFFKKEGPYTLEIIHETPFGFDILDQFYPLRVDRTIEYKGSLFTRE